jgi:TRAP-type uncharacterized transport system substrate-binding protein
VKSLLLIAFALLLLAAPAPVSAQHEQLVIASGEIGGTYRDVYAPGLGRLMYGYKVLQRSSSGSGENLELLASGNADLGFAQADVYAGKLAADPGRYGDLLVVGKLADECIYVAYRKAGRVATLGQLAGPATSRPIVVAAGPEASGSRGTWNYLARIVPGLERVEVRPEEGTLALNQLAAGAYDAVVWVTDPVNFDHYNLRAVLSNDALEVMTLDDPSLVKALADGTEVYRSRTVKLGEGWRAAKLATVCTSAMVFARKDADPKLLRKAADAVALHLREIVPRPR